MTNEENNQQFNNQDQTRDIFSEKWTEADEYKITDKLYEFHPVYIL
jgi:hypothetical protein